MVLKLSYSCIISLRFYILLWEVSGVCLTLWYWHCLINNVSTLPLVSLSWIWNSVVCLFVNVRYWETCASYIPYKRKDWNRCLCLCPNGAYFQFQRYISFPMSFIFIYFILIYLPLRGAQVQFQRYLSFLLIYFLLI